MKKGNVKFLVLALLLLAVASFSTYAIYKSSGTGTASADVARWTVKVNTADIVTTDTFTFSAADIVWDSNEYVAEGKIAPGSTGSLRVVIDTSTTDVAVDYAVAIDTTSITNPNITIGSITPSTIAASATTTTLNIPVTWTATDTPSANTADLASAGSSISIPVTVTLTQHVASN